MKHDNNRFQQLARGPSPSTHDCQVSSCQSGDASSNSEVMTIRSEYSTDKSCQTRCKPHHFIHLQISVGCMGLDTSRQEHKWQKMAWHPKRNSAILTLAMVIYRVTEYQDISLFALMQEHQLHAGVTKNHASKTCQPQMKLRQVPLQGQSHVLPVGLSA